MAGKPPVWVREALKENQAAIDRWLRTFTKDPDGVDYFEPNLEPLGGGHFGYAYRIHRGGKVMEGPATGLVLKITRDPTEGPFCRWIHEEQEKGNSLFQGAFARMYDVRRLSGEISWRGKSYPRFLIVREEVLPNGAVGTGMDLTISAALRALQIAGRQLAKPRKRGQAQVEIQVDSRGRMDLMGGGFLSSQYGRRLFPAEEVWEAATQVLEHDQSMYYIWEAFWQLRSEYDLLLQDVHALNIGKRLRMPSDDWSGATDFWVIFDPGHTPTNQGLPIEALEGRVDNPCHGVRVPVLR